MKILVTGASGFIGSNLVETFLKEGHNVVGMDNDKNKMLLLREVINHPNFDMVWRDVKLYENYMNHLKDIDIIYHMAAASDIKRSATDTKWDITENVLGTHCILELMRKENIERIIFPSTSVVYGENAPRPTPEDCPDRFPISQYAASKISAEAFVHAYSYMYGIKGWIFRFANVMGKHQHRGVVHDFVRKIENNPKELEILGDGHQLKSYIHVNDCMAGMFWAVEKDKNKTVSIYNLATEDQVTVTKLADIVCDEMGVKPKYKYTGGKSGWKGDMPKISLAIDKIKSLRWKPTMDCETAIRKTVGEIRNGDK